MATKFTATAPDGSEISFSSANRTYTHAIICCVTDEARAIETRQDRLFRGWKLMARVGRPELIDGALRAAEKHNRHKVYSYGADGYINGTIWEGRRCYFKVVPVVAVEKKTRKAVAA